MSDDVVADIERLCRIESNDFVLAVYRRAIDEIKKLRAQVADMTSIVGVAAVGKSFADLAKDLPSRRGESD